jgi:hypothetical protein
VKRALVAAASLALALPGAVEWNACAAELAAAAEPDMDAAVKAIADEAEQRLTLGAPAVAALEAARSALLPALAQRRVALEAASEGAASADVEGLVELDRIAVAAAFDTVEGTDPYFVELRRWASTLAAIRADMLRQLRPWRLALERAGRTVGDPTQPLRARCEDREREMDAARTVALGAVQTLRAEVGRRRELLFAQASDPTTLKRLEQTRAVQLEAWFSDRIAGLVAPLWQPLPPAPEGLAFLAPQTARVRAFVEAFAVHPICTVKPAFAALGCDALERNVARGQAWLHDTVPVLLRIGADVLGAQKERPVVVDDLEIALRGGDLTLATVLHDGLLTTLSYGGDASAIGGSP